MIKAYAKDDALLQDIEQAPKEIDGFHIWWLGQSGFLTQWKDQRILIDPYLSDSLTRKYASTDKPHVRMSELVVDPTHLKGIDIVTSSHNHTDHLDAETLLPLMTSNPNMNLIIPEANRAFVSERLGCEENWPIGLNDNRLLEHYSGINIHGIPAAHNTLDRDSKGQCHYMGYVFEFGPWCVYHSGDTLWHQDIIKALKPFRIDVAFLPINGNKPERRVAGNLNAQEAVRMAQTINAGLVIPCHYHMFEFNTVEPDEFVEIATVEKVTFKVMEIGERWTVE